ncbi:MAG TPA: NAD(P)/FAD-dependent oxidoreductase [Flavobacterium sp.]|nr:NAD(P)/FAD-dependent oxidoreductase [Flavobacterium sp.]
MQKPKNIAIVGSGLVGTLLAIYLRKSGHQVSVYDRSPDIRTIQFSGRSINLAMSNRGWRALENIGIADEIKKIAIAMEKRAIHIDDDQVNFQYYGKEGEAIYSISRGVLNRKMIDLAEGFGVAFLFNQKVWDVSLDTASLHVGQNEDDTHQEHQFDMVFGADGAFSRIRHKMQRQNMFNYSQEFLPIGYKELNIPPSEKSEYIIDKNSLHIWPRGNYMLSALPNLDGSFNAILFMPFEGENSFEKLQTKEDVETFFNNKFPDAVEIMPNLLEDFFKNPTSYLVTVKCFPWTYKDKVALIGDASHAIVPFYGHGMNAGFEDVTILDQMMKKYGDDWLSIFKAYERERKPNADAIAELSFRNFMEMSSDTADESFLLRKKIEKHFSAKHPDLWLPLYSMVTFSDDKTYDEALKVGDQQKVIMDEIMQLDGIEKIWNSEVVENKILELLKFKL